MAVCDEQTAGRGRLGRSWSAPAGTAILCSVLLRPPPERAVAELSLVGGVAVAEAVEAATTLAAQIKWPNDVLDQPPKGRRHPRRSDRGRRRPRGRPERQPGARASFPTDAKVAAGSLLTVDGVRRERAPILADLLVRLERAYDRWRDGGLDAVYEELGARDFLRGRRVYVDGEAGLGIAVDRRGRLEVEIDGERRLVESGEVLFERLAPAVDDRPAAVEAVVGGDDAHDPCPNRTSDRHSPRPSASTTKLPPSAHVSRPYQTCSRAGSLSLRRRRMIPVRPFERKTRTAGGLVSSSTGRESLPLSQRGDGADDGTDGAVRQPRPPHEPAPVEHVGARPLRLLDQSAKDVAAAPEPDPHGGRASECVADLERVGPAVAVGREDGGGDARRRPASDRRPPAASGRPARLRTPPRPRFDSGRSEPPHRCPFARPRSSCGGPRGSRRSPEQRPDAALGRGAHHPHAKHGATREPEPDRGSLAAPVAVRSQSARETPSVPSPPAEAARGRAASRA